MTRQQLAETVAKDCLDYLTSHYPEHKEAIMGMEDLVTQMTMLFIQSEGMTARQYTPETKANLLEGLDHSFRFHAGIED